MNIEQICGYINKLVPKLHKQQGKLSVSFCYNVLTAKRNKIIWTSHYYSLQTWSYAVIFNMLVLNILMGANSISDIN